MNSVLIKLGKKIRRMRKSEGLSQEKLARRAGLHYTYIGAVERGERNLSLRSLEKIARGLNVHIAEFFSFPQRLSPESQTREEIANLIRHKDLRVLELTLRVVKAIIGKNNSRRRKRS